MKASIQNLLVRFWPAFQLMLAALLLTAGCTTLGRNPLEGWKELGSAYVVGSPFGQTIAKDYKNYIQSLPVEERRQVDDFTVRFYENAAGQRAVRISTIVKGFWSDLQRQHVLIYDKNNKRIRTIKYNSGRSLS